MDREEHKAKHQELHKALDELMADWITHTNNMPSTAKLWGLVVWSHQQCDNPTEEKE